MCIKVTAWSASNLLSVYNAPVAAEWNRIYFILQSNLWKSSTYEIKIKENE